MKHVQYLATALNWPKQAHLILGGLLLAVGMGCGDQVVLGTEGPSGGGSSGGGGGTLTIEVVYPSSVESTPPHLSGDGDFDGHGPRVDVRVETWFDDYRIYARVFMDAEEWENGSPKHDYTRARGWSPIFVIHEQFNGGRIVSMNPSGPVTMSYVDTDHGVDFYSAPANSPVEAIETVGDTAGDEAGDRTRTTVYFRPLQIEVEVE